jgi:sugar lactone lactonase YvrE
MSREMKRDFMKRETKRELMFTILAVAALLIAVIAVTFKPLNVRADDEYQQVDGWGTPAGGVWGVMSAVSIDAKDNVFAFKRADPGQKESGPMNSKIMVMDSHGKMLRSWGDNLVLSAHGLRISPDGFVWITDKTGDQVFKFSPDGELLMTLGQKGVAGAMDATDALNGPSDVVVGKNGDIFVADGESPNTRVVKFSKDGKFIKFWGTKGAGPGELNLPHNIALDSAGNVYVANRNNKRIEVFDANGKYLNQLSQFGPPASIYISKDDTLYVAAGAPENWVMIGTKDGKVLGKISGLTGPHWVSVDSTGAIYVAEVAGMSLKKFVKK